MKKLTCSIENSRPKKVVCTVSAAALMLGVSSAATVGLHFQQNYCGGNPGSYAAGYSGFVVTRTAFGVPASSWENLTPLPSGYGSCSVINFSLSQTISTSTSTGGLNPLPSGSLDVSWSGPTGNYDQFSGYGGSPPYYTDVNLPNTEPLPTNATGEMQIYCTFIRDGINFGPGSVRGDNNQPGYLINVTGLNSLFTNSPFVVETMASADSMETLTNVMVIDVANSKTNLIGYTNTPLPNNTEGTLYFQGTGGGLSTGSAPFSNVDHIQIMSVQPQHVPSGYNHAGTISGFIVTDKPVVSMPPQSEFLGPQDTVTLNPYAIGVPPLSYQWRKGGVPIPNATNSTYTISATELSLAGAYDVVVSNNYGATTSLVSQVTVDSIVVTSAANVVADSQTANPQESGINSGATWLASSSDGSITRTGVMQFAAANSNGITVTARTNFTSSTGTYTLWMRSAGTASPTGTFGAPLVSWTNGPAETDLLLIQQDDGYVYFTNPQNNNQFDSVAPVSNNHWHFIALTYDQSSGGGVSIYIDGALDSTNSNGGNAWSSPTGSQITFGNSQDSTYEYYNGMLADVRFYSTQLTPTQISTIYHSDAVVNANALQMWLNFQTPPGPGLILSWGITPSILQTAPQVSGPFIDTPVVSPYLIVPSAAQQFFRYRGDTPKTFFSNPYLM